MPKRKPSVLLARMTPKLAEALSQLNVLYKSTVPVRVWADKVDDLVEAYRDMAEPRPAQARKKVRK